MMSGRSLFVLRILFYAVGIYILYGIVKRMLSPVRDGASQKRREPVIETPGLDKAEEMVQDPVCLSYIPRGSALSVREGEKVYYFCTEECRSSFVSGRGEGVSGGGRPV